MSSSHVQIRIMQKYPCGPDGICNPVRNILGRPSRTESAIPSVTIWACVETSRRDRPERLSSGPQSAPKFTLTEGFRSSKRIMQKYLSSPILLDGREEHIHPDIGTVWNRLGITNVIKCADGDSVLSFAELHRPEIVLMDIGIPGKPGEEVLEEIISAFPEITVIVRGENQAAPAVRCMKKGAADYLAKPVSCESLQARIRCAVENRERTRKDAEGSEPEILMRDIRNFIKKEYKMLSLGRIWTGIAHEIRNPLSAINIYLKILRDIFAGERDSSRKEVAEVMDDLGVASDRIEQIVKRVLDFSKPRKPDMNLSDVNQCIRESANLARVTLRKEGIILETVLNRELPEFFMEFWSVSQVILNLVFNAADAMKDAEGSKKVMITSSRDKDDVIIKVSDSGPGVVSENRNRIFEPFFTTKLGGLGIGLSICNRIIKDHGGYFRVGDSAMGGAEFQIGIPISEDDV
jgi:signal transduction histidine kinase